ncbi:MAG: hypothetical protein CSA97_05785 [Bacteroidetes bacterium]|nr:MAG: hypothetical protein CSA97_05785 [Bacteroidota bacterium]
MAARVYLDGWDIAEAYGATLLEGSLESLLSPPPIKDPPGVDWGEEDGLDVDLGQPAFATRTVELHFLVRGGIHGAGYFLESLAMAKPHRLRIEGIEEEFTLRLTGQRCEYVQGVAFVRTTLTEDDTAGWHRELSPGGGMGDFDQPYYIDGKPLSEHGVQILEGTRDGLLGVPAPKPPMAVESQFIDGRMPGGVHDTHQSREATVHGLMRGEDFNALWGRFRQLIGELMRPDERVVFITELFDTVGAHYKSCRVVVAEQEGGWLQFELTLRVLAFNIAMLSGAEPALCTEDGRIILTPDPGLLIVPDRILHGSDRESWYGVYDRMLFSEGMRALLCAERGAVRLKRIG